MTRPRRARWALLALVVLVSAACSKSEPPAPVPTLPTVTARAPAPPPAAVPPAPAAAPAAAPFAIVGVELGRQIDGNKKITDPTTTFAPSDTIYASVASVGKSDAVTIKARWTYGDDGQLVTEQTENVAPTAAANTEFHVAKPTGWPAGTYKVEITANGAAAVVKTFVVK